MLVKLKTKKRRAYQDTIQKVFKTKVTTDDSEFDQCVFNFKVLEKELSEILKSVLGNRAITERWSARNANLACLLAAHFNSDKSGSVCKTQSYSYMKSMTHIHKAVQNACIVILEKHVVEPLEFALKEAFPQKKELLAQHQGLKTDLESYRRRVQKLQDKGRHENDKDMIKLTRKLARTQASYDHLHAELMHELKQIYENRHMFLEPCFVALMTCQNFLFGEFALGLRTVTENLDEGEVLKIQAELQQLISAGGPSHSELENIRDKRNSDSFLTKSFKNLSRSLSKKSQKNLQTGNNTGQENENASPNQSFNSEFKEGSYPSPSSDTSGNTVVNSKRSVNIEYEQKSNPQGVQEEAKTNKQIQRVVAAFDYQDGDETDLSFSQGDVITVLDKLDAGWWKGQMEDGSTGLFPVTYVRAVEDGKEVTKS